MTQTYPFAVPSDEFKSKQVLVTGGTKGMGEAIVRRFLLSGAAVATTARSPVPQGQNPSLFVQTDMGTADGVRKVVECIQHEWHGLDILVNCLGGSEAPNGGFQALTDDDWQRALNVNLSAAVRLNRAFSSRDDRAQVWCCCSYFFDSASPSSLRCDSSLRCGKRRA
jgi:NAD(P)-dependent dehydrogenase (short-subunit alcohol dehydrogenase family)